MSGAVTHINLIKRRAPVHALGWGTLALFAFTLVGLVYYGTQLLTTAKAATQRRDNAAQQLASLKGRVAAQKSEELKNAGALALRGEVQGLQEAAKVAQALVAAMDGAKGGKSSEFARTLAAMTAVPEPGLWLTGLVLSNGGKKLELRGEARNGAAVLRFAQRTNDMLKPLELRMNNLELQPAPSAEAANAGAVGFKLE